MVAILNNDFLERSKKLYKEGNFQDALQTFEKAISHVDRSKDKSEYLSYLENLLKFCKDNNALEDEALVLRAMARIYSAFRMHADAMRLHWQALKLQKRLGKQSVVADGLVFLAEDLQISGNYGESIKAYEDASDIYKSLGKLRLVKELKKKIIEIKEFSKELIEDEYYLQKFGVDKY